MSLAPLAGSPTALAADVTTLQAAVGSIESAIALLHALAWESEGRAMVALTDEAVGAAGDLGGAGVRYSGTAGALQAYQIELADAHSKASTAITEELGAQADLARAQADLDHAGSEFHRALRELALSPGASSAHCEEWERRYFAAARAVEAAEARVALATAQYHQAADHLDDAAGAAISRIESSFDGTNDGLFDGVGDFFSSMWDGLRGLGDWAVDVFKAAVDIILDALEFVAQYLMLAVVVLVLVAVAALAVMGSFIALVVLAVVAAIIVTAVLREVGQGTPEPKSPIDAPTRSDGIMYDRIGDVATGNRGPYAQLFWELGDLDADGRRDRETEIRVVAITDATGNVVAWRVEIPSTKEWSPFAEMVNDLNTNVMHALFPSFETQMEKAVKDAMERAGVYASDAPIMFAGWSQGGTTSAEVALDPALTGRVESIVCAGSPVDSYRAELSDVRVTSFTHTDGVSGLEGARLGIDDMIADLKGNPNWVQYFDAGWHSTSTYAGMASDFQPDVRPGDEKFFGSRTEFRQETVYSYSYERNTQ